MTRTTLLAGGAAALAAATLLITAPAALADTPPPPEPVATADPGPPPAGPDGDTPPAPPAPVDGTPPAPPAPGEPGPGDGPAGDGPIAEPPAPETVTVESTVASTHTGRHGDVDGVVLADGTVVTLPPHAQVSAEDYPIGTPVRVEGVRHRTPDGDVHLHPSSITDTATGEQTTIERPEPPRVR